jgi:hypothetical protein
MIMPPHVNVNEIVIKSNTELTSQQSQMLSVWYLLKKTKRQESTKPVSGRRPAKAKTMSQA